MPIRAAVDGDWGGAASEITRPIGAADCGEFPSFDELVLAEGVPGRGVTIRAGVGHAKRTVAEIAGTCNLPPVVEGYLPGSQLVTGDKFYDKVGPAMLEVDTSGGWGERGTVSWEFDNIQHEGAVLGPGDKIRVTNRYGLVSNEYEIPQP